MGFLARLVEAFLIVAVFASLPVSAGPAAEQDNIRIGHDHYFNLEYDEAIASYRKALAVDPGNPNIENHIATAILFKELNRLGMLETSAFRGDNKFLEREKPQPDPTVAETFLKCLNEGRQHAEKILKQNSNDRMALFALSQNYGLQANYQFMIEKSYVGALRNGQRARGYSNKLRKQYPDFVDGYLIAGVQEYVVGSLPWAVRALVALGGISGNKQKGEEWVTMVADKGSLVRTEARVLLTLLYRRERRPLEAAELLEKLIGEFPRNYVLRLEMASMYEDAQKLDRALEIFRQAQSMVEKKAPGYERMPARLRDALARKIGLLQEKLNAGENRAARSRAAGHWARSEPASLRSARPSEQVIAAALFNHL